MTGGDTHVLCQSIQSYVTACQDAGVTVGGWRTPSFCREFGRAQGQMSPVWGWEDLQVRSHLEHREFGGAQVANVPSLGEGDSGDTQDMG